MPDHPRLRLALPGREIEFPRRPLLMGILNINDDSFSGDGTLDASVALARARQIVAEGGDIVDVGAESARTNREAISEEEEIQRLRMFLEHWDAVLSDTSPRDEQQVFPPVLSVNTWRPSVVRAALRMGAELVNDMSGLVESDNAIACAECGAALLVMHTVGLPKQPHEHIRYDDVVNEVEEFFAQRIEFAKKAGMSSEHLILDPGLGFAKQPDDDTKVCAAAGRFSKYGRPLLMPISRKGFLGAITGEADPARRDAATLGAMAALAHLPAVIFRVHNVDACWQAQKIVDSLAEIHGR